MITKNSRTLAKLYKKCLTRGELEADHAIALYHQSLNFLINFITMLVYQEAIRNNQPLVALGSSIAPWVAFQDMPDLLTVLTLKTKNADEHYEARTSIIEFLNKWRDYKPFRLFYEDRKRLIP